MKDDDAPTRFNAGTEADDAELKDLLDAAMGKRKGRSDDDAAAALAEPRKCYLGRLRDFEKELIPLDKEVFHIGRRRGDLLLDDETVSGSHCEIEVRPDRTVWITDQASTNGTYLNGKRVQSAQLSHYDTIRVGQTYFKFLEKPE